MSLWCHGDVIVMSLWCHCDVTVMLLWCYCDVTVMSLWCHCDVTVMLLWCHCDVTVMSLWCHWCHCDVTVMSLWCHWCYCDVTVMLLRIHMFGRTVKTVLFIMQANVWELLVKPCKLFFFTGILTRIHIRKNITHLSMLDTHNYTGSSKLTHICNVVAL